MLYSRRSMSEAVTENAIGLRLAIQRDAVREVSFRLRNSVDDSNAPTAAVIDLKVAPVVS